MLESSSDQSENITLQNPFPLPAGDTAVQRGGGITDTVQPVQQQFRFSDSDTAGTVFSYSVENLFAPTPKLFANHELKPVNSVPVPVAGRTPDWFTIILFVIVASFTWIRVFYFRILKQLYSAFFSNLVSNQIVRDENILVQRASILLSFVFYLTVSLFIYQLSMYFDWKIGILNQGFLRFLIIALIVAFAYSFKMVVLKAIGELFEIDKPVATYIFNIFLINNITGLILIPVVVLGAYLVFDYQEAIIYFGVGLVIIMFIYRLLRAFRIWMSMQRVSFFYLILYFCTLEIAPLLILFKLAGG